MNHVYIDTGKKSRKTLEELARKYRRKLMLIQDEQGNERVAMQNDFQDTHLNLTPMEWQELCFAFEYASTQVKPCCFSKLNSAIYAKLLAKPPVLKDGLIEIKQSTENTQE